MEGLKKPSFTLEKHQEIGKYLSKVNQELSDLSFDICGAYHHKDKRLPRDIIAMLTKLAVVRARLSEHCRKEYPEAGNIYFVKETK